VSFVPLWFLNLRVLCAFVVLLSPMTYRKKLIEVALPLEAINVESAREKSIRHGHPSTLHLWWARRPLAACRAVLWASLVDDPSSWPEKFPTEEAQNRERQRLFDILGRIELEKDKKGNTKQVVRGLVSWDEINQPNSGVLLEAQREIARCLAWERGEEPPTKPDAIRDYIAKYAPPAYDPFCGGGSIPLEAQRLGLQAHGSDLNPVAVLITKALIEIPPKFKDKPPVNPDSRQKQKISSWEGSQGLAADVRYYGQWMRDEAFKRIGYLYPMVETNHKGTKDTKVIAWLWARTVKCPNPACGCQMPLVRSFQLSTKKGKEAWVEPFVGDVNTEGDFNHKGTEDTKGDDFGVSGVPPKIRFEVKTGKGTAPDGTVNRKGAVCIACNTPVLLDHIRREGKAGRMDAQLMAIVAEGQGGRVYLSPDEEQEYIAKKAQPEWKPESELVFNSRHVTPVIYGMTKHADLFTPRQLVALTTFSDLVSETREKIKADAVAAGIPDDDLPLNDGGIGATAYADAVATYLAFGVDKLADRNSTIATWANNREHARNTFTRQAISMTWDFAESNPFSESSGNFFGGIETIYHILDSNNCLNASGEVLQIDAAQLEPDASFLFSTDPPYYDAVPYSDLSDFLYVWLRSTLVYLYPKLLSTVLVPKKSELVADPYRHGGKERAKLFFEQGLGATFNKLYRSSDPAYPLTVYYAFKQAESKEDSDDQEEQQLGLASTGWETMLEGLMQSNFMIDGTWPIRTELARRMRGQNSNALASSIVLVCRPRPADAPKASRRQFLNELKRDLPQALKLLQQGNIAPVDLAQASIGPGMAIYSKYAAILESNGTSMGVRTALQLINQILDEFLTEQEGEFDSDTRWALTWFEQYQFNEALYGNAETLSKAKNTSIQGMVEAGILEAKAGKVRLLKREDLKTDWKPEKDERTPIWEITQYLIHTLDKNGETGAAELLAKLGNKADLAKELAYRLYSLCDRKGWTQEAIAYNSLVTSWPEITRLANEYKPSPEQLSFSL
jgi:putative DNA methylase